MNKNYTSVLSLLFVSVILVVMYFTIMPRWVPASQALSGFATNRAMHHVKQISKEPHYVGSQNHKVVGDYLQSELGKMGLETTIQQGTTLSDWGNLVKSRNILARIKGSDNSKALLLLSHYDSAPHTSSHGAADNASGVAVILESVRAFLYNKKPHKNDIIILFSDAEELGLNGAALFVEQSNWAADVGLVLNFEARGTSGPAYMLMEVNNGNSAIVDGFAAANTPHPVSNSLMYSIYKMLPNDTDLTVFRENGKIQGLNFAFIDDHFNYHTAQDDVTHLNQYSMMHQASYLMPLLTHFSNAELNLDSVQDQVYFNIPFAFIHYPFAWNFILLTIAFVLFLFLVFVGMGKRLLSPAEMGKGFVRFFGALVTSSLVSYFGWKLLLALYPHYNDILHGFTYNGHSYIAAFISLSIAISFLFYTNPKTDTELINSSVAPLLLWLIINLLLAVKLPGAGFFIIPVLFALLMFGSYIATQRSNKFVNLLLSIPALFVFVPFIWMFPIGLGLKVVAGSAILTVLVFTLLLPIFGSFKKKLIWSGLFFLISVGFIVHAHINANFEPGKAKPNSLVYVYNSKTDQAVWATYDKSLDDWTRRYLTDSPKDARPLQSYQLYSKYNSQFTFTSEALVRDIAEPTITFVQDSVIGSQRLLKIMITPNRRVNRYDIFANHKMVFHNFKANGAKPIGQKGSEYKRNVRKILSYYVVDNEPLELQFSVPVNTVLDMELMESSFDLMTNPLFNMKERSPDMMPTPFVLTDAVVVIKQIKPQSSNIVPVAIRKNFSLQDRIRDTIPDPDSLTEQ